MTYSAGNYKWGEPKLGTASGEITWSADVIADLDMASGYSASEFNAALQDAFDSWESVASVDFQLVSADADVNLGVADIGGAAGQAYYTYIDRGAIDIIQGGTITFSSDLTWSPYGGGGSIDFYAVALHEIGHMIGLEHVSDRTEIMNPVIYADELGDGDIAGAQYLYGRDAGDVPAEEPADGGSLSSGSGEGGGGGGGVLGMLAALLALVFGIFSGAGAVAVAGNVPDEDDTPDDDPGTGEVFTSEPEFLYLPLIHVEEGEMRILDDEDQDLWLI